jgi:transcriptional regulator with XRE-family HTH domain
MGLNFGDYIVTARSAKNLSRSELARRVGITPQYMMDIERGRIIPNEEKISKLVEVLGCEEKVLFKLADKLPLRIIEKIKKKYYGDLEI